AATTYFAALQLASPGLSHPPPVQRALERAQKAVEENNRALESYIAEELAPLRARYPEMSLKRFDMCVDALLRKRRVFRQQPTFLFFPELPAIEFYDRALFPWLDELEAAAGAIRQELLSLIEERGAEGLEAYDPNLHAAIGAPDPTTTRRWR